MPSTIKVASFNVENLFERAAVLNKDSNQEIEGLLGLIEELQRILRQDAYSADDKKRIEELYNGSQDTPALKQYIGVREDRGKLLTAQGKVRAAVKGRASWDGSVVFKPARFSDLQRRNTARVLKDLKADIICMVEVENREILRDFDSELLNGRFDYEFAIDGNDDRGIDIGLLSNHRIGDIRTHMFEKTATGQPLFSRDCLELEVWLDSGQRLVLLLNHLKSKSGDVNGSTTQRRKLQAQRVAEILGKYDLERDWVLVAGDMNDTPDSEALKPLLDKTDGLPHLHDVLELQFGAQMGKRWTYFFDRFNQIDYILVSEPLRQRLVAAGVWRKGIHDLKRLTSSAQALAAGVDAEEQYAAVTEESNSASDHGAVWAEFRLD